MKYKRILVGRGTKAVQLAKVKITSKAHRLL